MGSAESWHDQRMSSAPRRVVALAPLLALTILTAGAGVLGYRTSQDSEGSEPPVSAAPTAPAQPTSSPSPTPFVKETPSPVPPVPTFGPATLAEARQAWDHALDKLIAAGSGKYSWAVYAGASTEPFESENGAFDLSPLRSRSDRQVSGPHGDPVTVHVRRFGATIYMRFEDWGRWDGCWLPVTSEDVERATGVRSSGVLPLPVGVLAIADASPSLTRGFWFGSPYREYTSELRATEALPFLGVSPSNFVDQVDRLDHVMVPITVSIDAAGRMHGGGARGTEVAKAISDAHVKLSRKLREGLPVLRASFAFREPGSAVSVDVPPPSLLLPRRASRSDSCKGGGPHA